MTAGDGMTRRDLARWIGVVSLGETVGFAVPAVVGATAGASPLFVPLLLAAGAVEGAILGGAQALVIRRLLPAVRPARWILLTAGAAVGVIAGLAMAVVTGSTLMTILRRHAPDPGPDVTRPR
jgi:hypothetical protein